MSTGNGNCLVLSVDNDDDSKTILHFDGTSAAFAGVGNIKRGQLDQSIARQDRWARSVGIKVHCEQSYV